MDSMHLRTFKYAVTLYLSKYCCAVSVPGPPEVGLGVWPALF